MSTIKPRLVTHPKCAQLAAKFSRPLPSTTGSVQNSTQPIAHCVHSTWDPMSRLVRLPDPLLLETSESDNDKEPIQGSCAGTSEKLTILPRRRRYDKTAGWYILG